MKNEEISSFFILHSLAFAGLFAGLAAYAYHSGRLAPLILAVLTAVGLGWSWRAWRRALPGLAAAALIGLLVLNPLLLYVAGDWAGYNRRVGAVSVFNSVDLDTHAPLALLARNLARYSLMWHVAGEPNGRHHAPLAPMLDPVSGALLLVGLGLALANWRRPERLALLIWLPLAILPGLLSSEAPHGMRSLGGLAPACVLGGLALSRCRQAQPPHRQRLRAALQPTALLLMSLSFNGWLYFGQMAHDPLVYGEFDLVETVMARAARRPFESSDPAVQATQVYLPGGAQKADTTRFLTSSVPLHTLDEGLPPAPAGASLLVLVPANTAAELVTSVLETLGSAGHELAGAPRDPGGAPLLRAFGVGAGAERLLAELAP